VLEIAKSVVLIVSALFPIVNPLGGSPIFLTLTHDYSAAARRALSRQISINSFFLLMASYFIGTHILAFFGISIPVVQVGGGMMVISNGWAMLKRRDEDDRAEMRTRSATEDPLRQAFYPLTLPLTVGPGSISIAITLGANAPHHQGFHPYTLVAAIVGMLLIAVSVFLCYGFAERLAKILGATAMSVIMRLSSFLLVCIGVQILWNGVSALLSSVVLHTR
jgi:multiple antibiotic resistance protein